MTKTLNVRQKQKYDTASNWTTNNPVLLAGEIGIESDTNKLKIGDGTTTWNSLSYVGGGSSTDVKVDGTSITSNNEADLKTINGNYNASSNKLATASDIPSVPTSDSDLTNDRYVRYDTASQGLNSTQKSNARTNIGAGTSNFSGSYSDLSNKPTIPTALSQLSDDSTHRLVTDSEKSNWNKALFTQLFSSCLNVGTDYNQGYLQFTSADGSWLKIKFGVANVNSGVTFSSPFDTIYYAMSSDASQSDAQSQRTTISSISTTGLSFKGGANMPARWIAIGK